MTMLETPQPALVPRVMPRAVDRYAADALAAVQDQLAPAAPPELLTAYAAWRRGQAQLRTLHTTTAVDRATPAIVAAQALLAGEDVPASLGHDLHAALQAGAEAEELRNVVVSATDDVGGLAVLRLIECAEELLTGPLTEQHDVVMTQVRTVVTEHGESVLTDDTLLRTNGTKGNAARTAVATLHRLHDDLQRVRSAHRRLYAFLTTGQNHEVAPARATMADLARARVLESPGFATAWPHWRRPQQQAFQVAVPETSPWDGTPVQQLLLLTRHGSWTPTPDQVAEVWLDAQSEPPVA